MNIQYSDYWLIAVAIVVILAIGVTGAVRFGFGAISDYVAVTIQKLYYNIVIFFLFNSLFVCEIA